MTGSEILLLLALVALNGIFAAAEYALVKIQTVKVEPEIQPTHALSALARQIFANLDSYFFATKLGIAMSGIALGWFGKDIAASVIIWLTGDAIDAQILQAIAFPAAFIALSLLHLVFGVLAPTSIAIKYPESTAIALSIPLRILHFILYPCIWLLYNLATLMLRIVGLSSKHTPQAYNAEELRFFLERGKESGAIESSEHELIENVFHFSKRTAKQIMVSRRQIVALDITTTQDEILQLVVEEEYSRLPVYRDTIDNIVGIVYAKDLLTMMTHRNLIVLQDIVRPALFVNESKNISALLREFQQKRQHLAVVLDEFGGIAGIVTLEDIIEELVGEIQDEFDNEKPAVEKTGLNEYRVSAAATITDANEFLPHPILENKDYETIGGLLNHIFAKIPDVNEKTQFSGYEFTILEKTQRKIESVHVRALNGNTSARSTIKP